MKRLAILLALCLWPALAQAQVTDHFTDANGTNLTAHTSDSGGTWVNTSTGGGSWSIQTNKAQGAQFFINLALRSEASFPNDQTAQIATQALAGTTNYTGVILRSTIEVRLVNNAGNADVALWDSSGFKAQAACGIASNVAITLVGTVTGNAVTATCNGGANVFAASPQTTIDTTGKPGLTHLWSGTDPGIDDFSSTAASASTRPPFIGAGVF